MRTRGGILALALLASLLSPFSNQSFAFGGYSSAPLNVSATAIPGGVRVAWSTPADVDTGLTGYRIEYSTTGTNGNWNTAGNVGSGTTSFDILGLSQISIYTRVAGKTSAGIGTYGYPWEKIYETTSKNRNSSSGVAYESGYGLGSGNASNTYSSSSFSRIRYRLETTISGNSYYADADFYEWNRSSTSQATAQTSWDASIASIMIPSINSPYQYSIQANVTDLNIYSSSPSVTKSSGSTGFDGRLEIWPWNYATTLSTLSDGTTNGNNGLYDFNDTPNNNGSYGSFQLHDMTNYKPVFVWNNTGYGAAAEIAYGKNTGTHPDWTFCSGGGAAGSCPAPSSFRLAIHVNIPVVPLADSTAPILTRIDSRSLGKNGDTITVRSTESGTIYLVNRSVSVSSITNINSASNSNKNSLPVDADTDATLTITSLSDGTYNLYAVDAFNNLSSPISSTIRIDNTAPSATSIMVNPLGTSIVLTADETITNSSQVMGTYTVSDGGSAISVSATTFSGNIATLTLSRAIPTGATVTFAYAPSSGAIGGRWIDQAGNEMPPIASRTISNNSGALISVSLSVPASIQKGARITITALVEAVGKVTFFASGKRIPGCIKKTATGSVPISVNCSWKPAVQGNQKVSVMLYPSTPGYPNTSSAQITRFVTRRSGLR